MTLIPTSAPTTGGGKGVNADLDYSTLSGGSWTNATPTGFGTGGGFNTSLTCASSTLCMGIGGNGILEVYNGSGWTAATVPGGNSGMSYGVGQEAFSDVSCAPGTSFCMATELTNYRGPGYDYLTYDNGSWSAQQQLPVFAPTGGSWGIEQAACTGAGTCTALVTDQEGQRGISAYSNGSWGSYVSAAQAGVVLNLSCSSASFCITSNAAGGDSLWTFTGSGLSEDPTSKGIGAFPQATNCVPGTSVFCIGAYRTPSGGGDEYKINTGSGWVMGPMPMLSDQWPVRLSCTSVSFCVIATVSGSSGGFMGFSVWPTAVPASSVPTSTAAIKNDLGKAVALPGKGDAIRSIIKRHGVSIVFSAPSPGRLTIRWAAGKMIVASLAQSVRPVRAGKETVKLALTGAGRHLLGRARRSLRLRATATFTPTGGARVAVSKRITLRH